MEAVDVVEDQRDDDDEDDESEFHAALSVLDDDAFEDVGAVLAAVGGFFEQVEHFLPLDDGDGVLLFFEQPAQRFVVDVVGGVLEPVDLDGELVDVLLASRAPRPRP